MITKPFKFNSFFAWATALPHFCNALPAYLFLELSDAFLLTILPALFFFKFSFLRPPTVLAFEPRKTMALAILPLAIKDFFIAFFFIAFMAFLAFMAFFIAAFIGFPVFMAFMATV